jgi:hypothetical protein
LDLLVDLSGFTRHSALDLLELRPAPVQAHYLVVCTTLSDNFAHTGCTACPRLIRWSLNRTTTRVHNVTESVCGRAVER